MMTPDLPRGVAFTAPPSHLLNDALRIVNESTAALPPDAHGAVVAVGTDAGINGAIVVKVSSQFEVVGWIGKEWGRAITYGGAATLVW